MIKIGLDLAFRTCGIAILKEDKLFYDSHVIKGRTLSNMAIQWEMTEWIFDQLEDYLLEDNELILEDIFKGRNFEALKNTARTQGAVVDRYLRITFNKNFPVYKMATTVRTTMGIPIQAPKVAIQLWAINKFNLGSLEVDFQKNITSKIEQYYGVVNSKCKVDMKKKKILKRTLSEYSVRVARITGVDEHMGDAIVLVCGG